MNQHTVALTRVFDAPRARVFECWTRAEHLQHWFGPNQCCRCSARVQQSNTRERGALNTRVRTTVCSFTT